MEEAHMPSLMVNQLNYVKMNKLRRFLPVLALSLIFFSASLSAQDPTPRRDNQTKLWGYVDKNKNWVIEPAFEKAKRFDLGAAVVGRNGKLGLIDINGVFILASEYDDIDGFKKNGLCRVMKKIDGSKWYGAVSSRGGESVVGMDNRSIDIDWRSDLICAEKYVPLFGAYSEGQVAMWGVYSNTGSEIFSPRFYSSPSFNTNGTAVVKDAETLLEGVVSISGNVIVPFENFSVGRRTGGFEALNTDFTRVEYDDGGRVVLRSEIPGRVIPYDTEGDDIRAALYRTMRIGEKLYCNAVKSLEGVSPRLQARTIDVDWGHRNERFIRLEPVKCVESSLGALRDERSGNFYTIAAVLYEKNGTKVQTVSAEGSIYAYFAEGLLYASEDGTSWVIYDDINRPEQTIASIMLPGYRELPAAATVQRYFDFDSQKRDIVSSWRKSREAHLEILKKENEGITARLPVRPAQQLSDLRDLNRLQNSPLFRKEYGCYEAYGAQKKPDGYVVCRDILIVGEDRFENPSYRRKYEIPLFWGPRNDYFIRLEPEYLKLKAIQRREDFIFEDGDDKAYHILVRLYDAMGNFVMLLGEEDHFAFLDDSYILLERTGIILTRRPGRPLHNGEILTLKPAPEFKNTVSVLTK